MEPVIKTRNLDITYNLGKKNEYKAGHNINLDIYPGEFIAFFGPSGCGKSTLFYSILGVLEPSAGELIVNGENPYSFSNQEMVKFQTNSIGIIYQSFYLIPSLSIIDNVALPQTFQGVDYKKRRKKAQTLLDRFGIGTKSDSFPTLLSGGQSQRVSICRAMVNDPGIILADEPTGNLDSISSEQVLDFLGDINKKDKKTIIIITHDAAQLNYAHRVIYVNDGRIQRIVPNPDKKQIARADKQKMLVTELDQLSRIFPYLTPGELKVKSIINYLTQDLTFTQIVRLEELTQKMLERKISRDRFFEILRMPLSKGGVEVTKKIADKMSNQVEVILDQSKDIQRYRRRQNQSTFLKKEDKLVGTLMNYLLEKVKKKIDRSQKMRLKQIVRNRVSGYYKRDDFYNELIKLKKDKGVGFSILQAKIITRYFEKILTQGVEIKSKFQE